MSTSMSARQRGQRVPRARAMPLMQRLWNLCPHVLVMYDLPTPRKGSRQMAHSSAPVDWALDIMAVSPTSMVKVCERG